MSGVLRLTNVVLHGSLDAEIPVLDPQLTVDYNVEHATTSGAEYVEGVHKCPAGHRHVVERRRGFNTAPVTVRWESGPETRDTYCAEHHDHCFAEPRMVCTIKTGTGECGRPVTIPLRSFTDRVVVVCERTDITLTGRTPTTPGRDMVLTADEIEPTPVTVHVDAWCGDSETVWCDIHATLDRLEMRS